MVSNFFYSRKNFYCNNCSALLENVVFPNEDKRFLLFLKRKKRKYCIIKKYNFFFFLDFCIGFIFEERIQMLFIFTSLDLIYDIKRCLRILQTFTDMVYIILQRFVHIYFFQQTFYFLFIVNILFVSIEILFIKMFSYGFRR